MESLPALRQEGYINIFWKIALNGQFLSFKSTVVDYSPMLIGIKTGKRFTTYIIMGKVGREWRISRKFYARIHFLYSKII